MNEMYPSVNVIPLAQDEGDDFISPCTETLRGTVRNDGAHNSVARHWRPQWFNDPYRYFDKMHFSKLLACGCLQ